MKLLPVLLTVAGMACSSQAAMVLINCGADATNTNGYNALTGLTAGETYTIYLLHGCGSSGTTGTKGNLVFQNIINDYSLIEINGSEGIKNGDLAYDTRYGGTLNANDLSLARGVQNYTALTFTVNEGASTVKFKFSTASQYATQSIALSDGTVLIPEPATATLGLLGLMGLMIRRRR